MYFMHYGIKHIIKPFMNNCNVSVVVMTPMYKCAKSIYQQYCRSDLHVLKVISCEVHGVKLTVGLWFWCHPE